MMETQNNHAAVHKKEYILAEAQRIAHLGSWEFDVATRTLTLSEEMYRIYGLDPRKGNLAYTDLLACVHPADRAAVVAGYQKAIRDDAPYDSIYRIIRQSDGAIREIHNKCEHTKDAAGRIVGFIGIVHDITEQRQMEQALEQERLRYKMLTAAYRDGIAIINQDHQVVEANQRFAEMLGYTPAEVLTLHTWDWEAIMTEPEIRTAFSDLTKTSAVFESRHRRKDGSLYDVEVSACGTQVGEEALVFTISRDITERKRAEDELRLYREHLEELVSIRTAELIRANQTLQREIVERTLMEEALRQAKELAEEAQREAEAANRVKSEFLSNMSHEVRTPLNAVLGFTGILETLITDQEQKRYLSLIKAGGQNLLSLMNDILDLSTIESGKLQLAYESVNLKLLIYDLIQLFQVKVAEKGLMLQVDIPADLPECIMIDGVRLRQVLLNVLGNAVKFTHHGAIRFSVSMRQKAETADSDATAANTNFKTFVFAVEDTGIGIPADQQQLIFDAFRQQDGKITRKYGGTGLGLAITKRLVDLMRGTITLSSVVGKGSCFTITLPRVSSVSTSSECPDTPSAVFVSGAQSNPSGQQGHTFQTCALPPELLSALEQAAIQGDMENVETALNDIRALDAGLGDALTALANEFEYGKILEYLRENMRIA